MRSSSTDELMGQFLAELSTLSVRANVAAKLRRAELVAGLATVDEGTGELQDKLMVWIVASRRNPATQFRHIPATWRGTEGRLEVPF